MRTRPHTIPAAAGGRGGRGAEGGGVTRLAGALRVLAAVGCLVTAAGCNGNTAMEQVRQAMYDQAKYEPYEGTTFFPDGRASRTAPEGTVARGRLRTNTHLYEGRVDGVLATALPVELTEGLVERGRERYDIFCTPCHGALGDGDGMAVRRGMKAPPSFHTERLRDLPIGHMFDVMTNGYGAMYSYASRIPVKDRWAIAAYVRALQLSRNATIDDVPPSERDRLEGVE